MAEENNIQENSDSESEGSEDSPRRPAISLAIPKNFQHIDGSEVAKIVKEKDSNWVLIDVRDVDFDGGHIVGSKHVHDFESQARLLANEFADKNVVFICTYGKMRSPTCALTFIQQDGVKAENVYVLQRGIQDFIVKYKDDPSLVEDFKKESWNEDLTLHMNDANAPSFRGH